MISKKLKLLFLLSIPLFITHGLEEYFTGFFNIDPIFKFVFQYFENMTVFQATFLLFQIMLWLFLITFFFLILGGKWPLRLMVILGVVLIFELHHIIRTIVEWSYYPGTITALLFPILAFFFWKELINNFKELETQKLE